MGRFDFTSENLFDEEPKEQPEETPKPKRILSPDEQDELTTSFIKETIAAFAPPESGKSPVVIDIGGLLLFLFFDKTDDASGNLVDACLAMSMFGQEWVLIPADIADWMIDQLVQYIYSVSDDGGDFNPFEAFGGDIPF